ncbi:MAG: hypothetical protein A2542_00545 [Parcubacteria group bacterium RIFOXYD2_FULL_52_8]|nr:MAG: hypothetical protein A2542_00545 [Parcubacteria group bacterium RIFOXYD2_FULL_52_8]
MVDIPHDGPDVADHRLRPEPLDRALADKLEEVKGFIAEKPTKEKLFAVTHQNIIALSRFYIRLKTMFRGSGYLIKAVTHPSRKENGSGEYEMTFTIKPESAV